MLENLKMTISDENWILKNEFEMIVMQGQCKIEFKGLFSL